MLKRICLLVASLLLPLSAAAIDVSSVKPCHHTPFGLYMTPFEAWEMKRQSPDGVLFVDVRTRSEVQYVGFTEYADANIPFMLQPGDYAWLANEKQPGTGNFRKIPNRDFVTAMDRLLQSRGLDRSAPLILMCTSGKRSTGAAKLLHKAGYGQVYNLYEGFEGEKAQSGPFKGQRVVNGWKNAALPWGYRLPASKMYFNFAP